MATETKKPLTIGEAVEAQHEGLEPPTGLVEPVRPIPEGEPLTVTDATNIDSSQEVVEPLNAIRIEGDTLFAGGGEYDLKLYRDFKHWFEERFKRQVAALVDLDGKNVVVPTTTLPQAQELGNLLYPYFKYWNPIRGIFN